MALVVIKMIGNGSVSPFIEVGAYGIRFNRLELLNTELGQNGSRIDHSTRVEADNA